MGLEERIKELKKQKNMTSEELAKQSGVPLGTLNKILNGTTKDPKVETLKALCPVLGCTLDELLGPQEPETVEDLLRKLSKKKPHTAVLMGSGGKGGQEIRELSEEKYQKILKLLELLDDEKS